MFSELHNNPVPTLIFWFGLLLYAPVNIYGHVRTVSSPDQTFFLCKLEQKVNQYFVYNTILMQNPTLMLNLKRMNEYKKVSEYDQKILQSHIADQTQRCDEEPQNTNNPNKYMERYEQNTHLTRSENIIKQQHSRLCIYIDVSELYPLLNSVCTTNTFPFCLDKFVCSILCCKLS